MHKAFIISILVICISCHQRSKQYLDIPDNTIINLYDAFGENIDGVTKDFGFSCIIKSNGKTILFDAGTNADIFKKNIEALKIDLTTIDFAVASHSHFDHINGFDYLLKINPDVKIYYPFDMFYGANIEFGLGGDEPEVVDSLDEHMKYFNGNYSSYKFNQTGRFWGADIEFVNSNTQIDSTFRLIFTRSPFMGYFNKYPNLEDLDIASEATLNGLPELSLSIRTEVGEVIIVGCSHSTVEKIAMETISFTENEIELVYGGYHLLPYDRETLSKLAIRLKQDLSVNRVAPAHCTGHLAFKVFQDIYNGNYVFAGLGSSVKIN